MGYTQAAGFAEAVTDGLVSLDGALRYHLFTNHYPPLPLETLELSKQALELAAQDEWEAKVDLGESGISHRKFGTQVPAIVLIKSWHLGHFIGAARQLLESEDEEE